MTKKRIGRPTKLTPSVQDAIITAIQYGSPYKYAALYAGVSDKTLGNWMRWGEAVAERIEQAEDKLEITIDEKKYLGFFRAVEQANAEAMLLHLQNLEAHSKHSPDVSKWILERRFPDTFGPPTQKQQSDVNLTQRVRIIDYGLDDDGDANNDTSL